MVSGSGSGWPEKLTPDPVCPCMFDPDPVNVNTGSETLPSSNPQSHPQSVRLVP